MYEISDTVRNMSQYDGLMKRDETCEYVCKKVGENIGRLREEHEVSQAELARRIEVSRPNLNKVESGNQNFSLDYLVLLANGLDIPVIEFFSGVEKDSPRVILEKSRAADRQ